MLVEAKISALVRVVLMLLTVHYSYYIYVQCMIDLRKLELPHCCFAFRHGL